MGRHVSLVVGDLDRLCLRRCPEFDVVHSAYALPFLALLATGQGAAPCSMYCMEETS